MTDVLLGCILIVLLAILYVARQSLKLLRRWHDQWANAPLDMTQHNGDLLLESVKEVVSVLLREVVKVEVMPTGSNRRETHAEQRAAWARENRKRAKDAPQDAAADNVKPAGRWPGEEGA
jgi:hypothetical protein